MNVGVSIFLLLSASACTSSGDSSRATLSSTTSFPLPDPRLEGDLSVEAALAARRSVRSYARQPLSLADLGQLLWAAQGISGANRRYRTAPSAGALYPLELYAVVGDVEELDAGVYHYDPAAHALTQVKRSDVRAALSRAALGQAWVEEGAVVLVFAAVYERTTGKYGTRGRQYVHMEAGHASQNVYLQATALELGTVAVGAFDDNEVQRVVGLSDDERPLYLMPVGRRR
ncbi:MAG: SagB/ThcOx family dehydrogenase [Anaerolineae bacterium]